MSNPSINPWNLGWTQFVILPTGGFAARFHEQQWRTFNTIEEVLAYATAETERYRALVAAYQSTEIDNLLTELGL